MRKGFYSTAMSNGFGVLCAMHASILLFEADDRPEHHTVLLVVVLTSVNAILYFVPAIIH